MKGAKDYSTKYKVFYFLLHQRMKTPNDFYSVREIAKALGVQQSTFWNERHVRNAIIELISEHMVETQISRVITDWRMLIRAEDVMGWEKLEKKLCDKRS